MAKNARAKLELELAAASVHDATDQVEGLLSDLRGENPDTRIRAARTLGNMGGQRVISAMIEALGDTDAQAFEAIKEALLMLRPSSIPPIVQALQHPASLVRAGALELIGEMHYTNALEAVTGLITDPAPEVRTAAANVLIRLEGERAINAVAPLVEDVDGSVRLSLVKSLGLIHNAKSAGLIAPRLQDYDPAVRRATVEALAQIGDQYSVEALRGMADDPDEQIANLAESALQAIGERAVGPFLDDLAGKGVSQRLVAFDALVKQGKAAVQPLLAMLDHRNPTVRLTVIQIMGAIGDELALPGLVRAVGDRRREVRTAALEAVGRINTPRATAALLDVFAGDDVDLIDIASRALLTAGGQATEVLIGFLRSDNPDLRLRAAMILGQIRDQQAIGHLIEVLRDEGHSVRSAAAAALGQLLDPAATPSLLVCLADPHPSVRASAAEALGHLRDLRAAGDLEKLLADPQDMVRAATVRALGRIGEGGSIEPLMKMMDDSSPEVRAAAIEALGNLRVKQAEERLRRFARPWVVNFEPEAVRRAARHALEELRKSREEEVEIMKAQVESSQSSKVTYS